MTPADYKVIRDAKVDFRVRIANLIDKAGERGWETLSAFEKALNDDDAAWRAMSHEDQMVILAEEQAERDALLARINADREKRGEAPL